MATESPGTVNVSITRLTYPSKPGGALWAARATGPSGREIPVISVSAENDLAIRPHSAAAASISSIFLVASTLGDDDPELIYRAIFTHPIMRMAEIGMRGARNSGFMPGLPDQPAATARGGVSVPPGQTNRA